MFNVRGILFHVTFSKPYLNQMLRVDVKEIVSLTSIFKYLSRKATCRED